jgi:outer membrane receptor protein involved in Fe transport
MGSYNRGLPVFLLLMFFSFFVHAQRISGVVEDYESGETIIGASVVVQGTNLGTSTDFDGKFVIEGSNLSFPLVLEIRFIGYEELNYSVKSPLDKLKIRVKSTSFNLNDVTVVEQRITKKQQEAALTVESLDVVAIKEAPSGNFYENLGNLKGVDITSASLGFKVINTRGFNSTSPVRTLQLIDGVDNQAPGLNFSLGNFLGASDLDVKRVELVAGASSAFYGPGAFNGVINMETKDPWNFRGLDVSFKGGERALTETALRYAHVFENKDGEEKFAMKFNIFYLQANDWEATNYQPVFGSPVEEGNLGGWDAINIYGDEDVSNNNNAFTSVSDIREYPGLGEIFRTGYREEDLVDYDTRNGKFATSLHYRFNPELELTYGFNYGTGTTVYQGDNRFSLKNIQFFQNRLELAKKDKWFIRAYATNEDAGDTYDAVFTAFKMQEFAMSNEEWINAYSTFWASSIVPQIKQLPGVQAIYNQGGPFDVDALNAILAQYQDTLAYWHNLVRENVDDPANPFLAPFIQPGTAEYDSLFNDIISKPFSEGGSRFYDRSALYHVQGEYRFEPSWADYLAVGGNFRQYNPDSRGTIFSDTADNRIVNREFGFYAGAEERYLDERLKVNATLRMDKNQNFDLLFSPAVSAVYNLNENNTFRVSFSSAVRNPTLQDQYLYYNVGRAILLGNLNGYDSLVTTGSFRNFLSSQNPESLDYFNVDPIRPERVRTLEVGMRSSWWKKIYVDATAYHSWYTDFIGFQIGIDMTYNTITNSPSTVQAYRIAANSSEGVTTMGAALGVNYYLNEYLTLNANYSWNRLEIQGEDDGIIPAFNTPEHKYNLGITGRDIEIKGTKIKNLGFGVNYKWIEGFLFEGSPQFTGFIDSYGLVDAQINYRIEKWNTTLKVGGSNVLNNRVFQVYGGPIVGRLLYGQVVVELFRDNQ